MALRLIGKAPPDASMAPIAASSSYATQSSLLLAMEKENLVLSEKFSPSDSPESKLEHRKPLAVKKHDNRTLRPHPSKLDLIDHTTLTSLPLPPPAKTRLKRGRSIPSIDRSSVRNALPDQITSSDATETTNQEDTETYCDNDFADITMTSEFADETLDEAEDLIVLVEDYLAKHDSDKPLDRSKSLLSFKKRLHADRRSVDSTEPTPKRRAVEQNEVSTQEDLEAIFGRIPGTDGLKHCCLCDRPLYEISSIIGSGDYIRRAKKEATTSCKEFVCWDCVDSYEQYLMEESKSEAEEAEASTGANERLFEMFKQIRDTYSTPLEGQLKAFSSDLIKQLHELRQPTPENKDSEWLTTLKKKLRWRWRLYGLLPSFTSHSGYEP